MSPHLKFLHMTRKFSTDNVRGVRDKYQVWGGGVWKPPKLADVICGQPLSISQLIFLKQQVSPSDTREWWTEMRVRGPGSFSVTFFHISNHINLSMEAWISHHHHLQPHDNPFTMFRPQFWTFTNTLKTMHFALSVIGQGIVIPELARGSKMCSASPRTSYSL